MKLEWPVSADDKKYDWVLNTFDSENPDAALVPLDRSEPWDTIAPLALRTGGTVLFGTFPALTQLRPRFIAATESVPLPGITLPPAQAGALPSLLSQLAIGGIVLPQREFAAVADIIKNVHYRGYFQVLLGLGERPTMEFPNLTLLFEMHLVPGMVGLFQCDALAAERTAFHPNRRFRWEFEGEKAYVSDFLSAPRFSHIKFPHRIELISKPCACGEQEHVRLL
ncbi:MAG: hypothetical protein AAB449_02810 [Patescibacteria group bacterium]